MKLPLLLKQILLFISFFLIIINIFTIQIFAHSGRTNSEGCHNDYISGGYHCHSGTSYSENSSYGEDSLWTSGIGNIITVGGIIFVLVFVIKKFNE